MGRHRLYSAKDLLYLKEDPNAWIIKNMIPRVGRILVYGDGSSYKTTVLYDLCVAIASNGKMLGRVGVARSGPVLVNSTEDSIYENKRRLMRIFRAHNVNPAKLPLWFCHEPFLLDEQQDVAELDEIITSLHPVAIMLDPLDSFFSGEENSATQTKPLRFALNDLVKRHDLAAIVIHHAAKNREDPRGSSTWYNWADTVLYIKVVQKNIGLEKPIDIATITAKKQRNGEKGHVVSVAPIFDEARNIIYFAIYDGKQHEEIVTEYYKLVIYKTLQGSQEPLTTTQLVEKIGLRMEKIGQALDGLEAEGYIARDACVLRNFGAEGTRKRAVPAWHAVKKFTLPDMAECVVRLEEDSCEQDNEAYEIRPEAPGAVNGGPCPVRNTPVLPVQGVSGISARYPRPH